MPRRSNSDDSDQDAVILVKEVTTTTTTSGALRLNDSWRPMEEESDDDSSTMDDDDDDGLEDHEDAGSEISGYRMFTAYGTGLWGILLREYWKFFNEKPVVAKAITSSIVGALGAMVTARKYHYPTNNNARNNTIHPRKLGRNEKFPSSIDWLDVIAFTVHGGLVGGPISHYWNEWLRDNGPESQSMSMLFDQLMAQPPLLFIMYVFLDMTRAAVKEIPNALNRSTSTIGSTVALSWRFWPIVVYVMLRFLKKRKHYTIAMNVCSLYWISQLAQKRSLSRKEMLEQQQRH